MKTAIIIVYLACLLFTAAMSLVHRRVLQRRRLTILIPYLILVFIQETTLLIADSLGYVSSSAIIYNIYRPITVIVFVWLYYGVPFMASFRKLIAWLSIVYLLIVLANYCFIESIFTTSSYLTLARGFVITFCAVLFLFSYFQLDNLTEEKYWHPYLWITIGVVVFYPVISISVNFQKYLAANSATLYGFKVYQVIPQVMSIFMYSCFSYAFYLCQKKE